MRYRSTLLLSALLYGLGSLGSGPALAQSALTRAVVQSVRNQVRILPRNQSPRPARISDSMTPGDGLSTAASSLAELRFNDGSLARVGERAVFRFVARTRTFQLSNGTMLLLIPPGRGGTTIRTPNATAAIRGSALFVRYNAETDTTIVGALTNNPAGPMVLSNQDGSQQQDLMAGQMAVLVQGRIERVYKFDLQEFYRTSDLVEGLNLQQVPAVPEVDEAIAQVRAETTEALQAQTPVTGSAVIENPGFLRLSSDAVLPPSQLQPPGLLTAATRIDAIRASNNRLDVPTILGAGEVQISVPSMMGLGNGSFRPNSQTSIGQNFPDNRGVGGPVMRTTGGGLTGRNFPGGGATGGTFPGGGATGGTFPGGGATGGTFPGGGATGGMFPGGAPGN